jgi:hypothetical protein
MKKQFKNSWSWRTGCPTGSAEARQISLLGCAQKAAAATGWYLNGVKMELTRSKNGVIIQLLWI